MSSNKGKSTLGYYNNGNPRESAVSDVNHSSGQDEGWEVYGKKAKNKAVVGSSKQGGPQPPSTKAWGQPDTMQRLGVRNSGGSGRGSGQSWPTLPADSHKSTGRGFAKLQWSNNGGRGWGAGATALQPSQERLGHKTQEANHASDHFEVENDDDEELDDIEDSDDELLSDGFDSDESQKSHETRKKNKWFTEFFRALDTLTIEQINEPDRQWHCPACKGGPGAIDWYRLQPLVAHAKTKRSIRVKLHRELAELVNEELRRRGTSAVPAGEMFGQWRGLEERDREIVWPPMVIIMNTRLEKDDNDKWKGMGNQELMEYFSSFSPSKSRHSYGPQGHRGISVLIFEASAVGYAEAERLSKHFEDRGRDRQAWERYRVPFYAGGKRQLYGYMAEKHDMENFNQHSQGKTRLKYEMRSFLEMVPKQMKQMSEDNQQLEFYKDKVAKEQRSKKALVETLNEMTEKFRRTSEENRIVKLRSKELHDQNRKEMDFQDQFYEEHVQKLQEARNAKEEILEKVMQSEREKVVTTQSEADMSTLEESLQKAEVKKFIETQDKEADEFSRKRDERVKAHEDRKLQLKIKQWQEQVALEEEFNAEMDKLIMEYRPDVLKQDGVEEGVNNLSLDGNK